MKCAKCIRALESLSGTAPGLGRVEVNFGENVVTAEVDVKQMPVSQLAEMIAQRGFDPVPLSSSDESTALIKAQERRDLIRLAVAGACAGNIMTFAFAVYSGADPRIFLWLSFALYIPVVTFVALPFYQEAWSSLRHKRVSIDLPMAVASFAGFAFSTYELARGVYTGVYFDSLAGFLFLILAARFAQRRLQRKFAGSTESSAAFERARAGGEDDWHWTPAEKLKAGDEIQVRYGEAVPCDGKLLSSRARFSTAWLSGESSAKVFLQGATVPAGAQCLDLKASLDVEKPLSQTAFGNILSEIQRFPLSRNKTVTDSDRLAQWLLVTVFSIAAAYLLAHWHISPEEAIARSLSLIVLACPCAMAFGTPLALSASLKNAKGAGLLIRDAGILLSARDVKTIFLDKTGTVTEARLSLKEPVSPPAHFYRQVILGLENLSLHPIAFAFREAYGESATPANIQNLREVPGDGVQGEFGGRVYRLIRSPLRDTATACALYEDGKLVSIFKFEPAMVQDARETLDNLRSQGYRLELLSGDERGITVNTGLSLGFSREEIHFELTPQEKEKIVESTPHAMMVGDGINDSLAMLKAQASVAVSGGVESAMKSAGAYLTQPGLSGIAALLFESRAAYRLIRANLAVSIAYNILGGTAALLGFVNPLTAALLMPVSSGFILVTTYLGSRR
jgi:Cu2+-exporting ATPase/Cu+-exporting ATPase